MGHFQSLEAIDKKLLEKALCKKLYVKSFI